jgi:hypothetical protein
MSSAQATVDETVAVRRSVYAGTGTSVSTVLAAIAIAQVVWLAALVYGAIWLLT